MARGILPSVCLPPFLPLNPRIHPAAWCSAVCPPACVYMWWQLFPQWQVFCSRNLKENVDILYQISPNTLQLFTCPLRALILWRQTVKLAKIIWQKIHPPKNFQPTINLADSPFMHYIVAVCHSLFCSTTVSWWTEIFFTSHNNIKDRWYCFMMFRKQSIFYSQSLVFSVLFHCFLHFVISIFFYFDVIYDLACKFCYPDLHFT